MSRLEIAATLIQHDLPLHLLSGDTITDAWLKETTGQMAAALRALKKWILMPRSDTRDQFIARIAASLEYVAAGNWDGLERAEPEKLSRPQRLSRAVALLRMLFIATLPLLMLWAVQQTPLALEGAIGEYATAGALIWVALTLLAALDPRFGEKIETLKDVTQFLPQPGKE